MFLFINILMMMESVIVVDIECIVNVMDSEDVLKYFLSLFVCKCYIGDYNYVILFSCVFGIGNSVCLVVYVDGILLFNYLGNGVGGLSFLLCWGLVMFEEIECVDVMYGFFLVVYFGNLVGVVVDYVMCMLICFEVYVQLVYVIQFFEFYGCCMSYCVWQVSVLVGDCVGDLSWWFNVNCIDSQGQLLIFVSCLISIGMIGFVGIFVIGVLLQFNSFGQFWWLLGVGM